MLKKSRNESRAKTVANQSCSCCNSKQKRRSIKHGIKQNENRMWRNAAFEEVNSPEQDAWESYDHHIYEGERCIYCNSNVYDNMIYGDDGCVPNREMLKYTIESKSF